MSLTLIIPKRHILITPDEYPQEFLDGCVLRLPLWGYQHRMVGSKFADYSPYGNHGTPYGGYWERQGQTRVRGFDGVDDYVEAPHVNACETSCWTKFLRDTSNDEYPIGIPYDKASFTSPYFEIALERKSSNRHAALGVAVAGSWTAVLGNKFIPTNEWHFLRGGYDGSTMRIYTDNDDLGLKSKTGAISRYGQPAYIGTAIPLSGHYVQCLIAEVMFYDKPSYEQHQAQFLYDIQHLPFLVGATYLRKAA